MEVNITVTSDLSLLALVLTFDPDLEGIRYKVQLEHQYMLNVSTRQEGYKITVICISPSARHG